MPSLIYIARIKSFSEELATSLRSAGCHVKSFKPGDITQDECLLVMTSEAVGATPDPQGHRAETGRTVAGTPVAPDMNEQLGSQAATWNRIKMAVTKESQAKREQVAAVASTDEQPEVKLRFTPTEVERRPVSKAQYGAIGEIAPIEPSRIIAVSSAETSRTLKNIRPTKERLCRVLRNPLSTVVAVLLFSVVYRGLMPPSRKGISIPREANYDTRANSDSANSLLNVSASPGRTAHRSIPPLTPSSAEPPLQAVDRVQRHLSHHDYVAQDFTNRFALHAQGSATRQNKGKACVQIQSPQTVGSQ